jgi:hypothetical protein
MRCCGRAARAWSRRSLPVGPTSSLHRSTAAPTALPRSALKRAHRARAAALRRHDDPLLAAVSDRLLDRLEDCVAKFPTAVILGGAGARVQAGRV